MDDFRRSNHSVTKLVVHLVFVTKYRRKVLDEMALDWLQHLFGMVCIELGCTLVAADGEADHFHLLIEYPPTISISEVGAETQRPGEQATARSTPGHCKPLLEGCSMDTELFRGIGWRRAAVHNQEV